MTSRLRATLRALTALLLYASYASAQAIPLGDPLDDPFSNVTFDFSRGVNIFGNEAWRYDADSQLLSYLAGGAFEYRAPGQLSAFAGSFMWEARVDSAGNLLDGGTMTLAGDFGSGSRLLASGSVLDIGFGEHGDCTPDLGCGLLSFHAIFDNAWLDESIRDLGSRMGLFFELEFFSDTPSPFVRDFSCGLAPGESCPMFSTSGLTAIRVPEPSTPALAGLCALLLGWAWRVRGSTLTRH